MKCSTRAARALSARCHSGHGVYPAGPEGNPTTGYTWEMLEPEGAILRQVAEPEFNAESDLLGPPGILPLRFEAVEVGQMELRLVYRRPWETSVEPAETFTVQVTVH